MVKYDSVIASSYTKYLGVNMEPVNISNENLQDFTGKV